VTSGGVCIRLGHRKDLFVVGSLAGQLIDLDLLFDETSLCCSKNYGMQIRVTWTFRYQVKSECFVATDDDDVDRNFRTLVGPVGHRQRGLTRESQPHCPPNRYR
jgi:hypothetical protein